MGSVNKRALQAGRGQGGINLERTPDLSLGSGIDLSVGSGIRDLSLERELEPFNSSYNKCNQSQSGDDNFEQEGRGGSFSMGGYEN